MVGTSGSCDRRLVVDTPSALMFPLLICGSTFTAWSTM